MLDCFARMYGQTPMSAHTAFGISHVEAIFVSLFLDMGAQLGIELVEVGNDFVGGELLALLTAFFY